MQGETPGHDAPPQTLSFAPKLNILDALNLARTRPVDPLFILTSQTLAPRQVIVNLDEVIVPQHRSLWLQSLEHVEHALFKFLLILRNVA